MEALITALLDFVKVRQLNFAVAALLTVGYLVYQYWGLVFYDKNDDHLGCSHSKQLLDRPHSRSRSRSRTRSRYEKSDANYSRRRPYGRCPDCSRCNSECAQ